MNLFSLIEVYSFYLNDLGQQVGSYEACAKLACGLLHVSKILLILHPILGRGLLDDVDNVLKGERITRVLELYVLI